MKKPIALVFDLGNVLLPIDLDKTFAAFALYSSQYSAADIKQITQEEGLWALYEAGIQSDQEFEELIINRFQLTCTSEEFKLAFNALLLSFDETLAQYVHSLRSSFPLYLLSNTSNIHSQLFLQTSYPNFDIFDAFRHIYLSFKMGVVKPNKSIYEQLVNNSQLHDHHIVFFDDNIQNIESACDFGWEAVLIDPPNSLHQIQQHIESLC